MRSGPSEPQPCGDAPPSARSLSFGSPSMRAPVGSSTTRSPGNQSHTPTMVDPRSHALSPQQASPSTLRNGSIIHRVSHVEALPLAPPFRGVNRLSDYNSPLAPGALPKSVLLFCGLVTLLP